MSLIREFTAFELRPFQGGIRVLNPDGTPQALPGTYEIRLFRHGATAAFVTGSVAGGELTVNAGAGTIDFSFAAAAMTSVVGYGAAEIRDMAAGGRVLSVIPVRFLPQATPWQPEYNERLVLHSNTSVVVVKPLAAAGGAVVAEGSYGDVGVTGSGLVWTIANDAVGNSKLANMAAGTVKANITGAAADPADVTRAALVPWLALQAGEIVVTPSGGIASATVAAALTELDTEKLDKAGGTISGNLIITGSLIHNGATYQVNATTVTYDDIILVIGGDTAPVVDDGRDRGVEFRWHDGSTAKLGFFGFDRSAQEFTFIPDATDTADVISGTAGTLRASLNGNAATASAWATGRSISLTGMVTGVSGAFDGSGNLSFATVLGSFTLAELNAAVSDADLSASTHTHLLATGATDVTITAANLNTLDDGVNTALHFHDSDRARANHTGMQVAATISDFAATVIASVLTGFAVAGARTAIAAADSVLAAFGKVQKYLNDLSALAFSGNAGDLSGTKSSTFISDFAEAAQDAVGAAFDSTLAYGDAGNSMGRAAISGHITIAAGSNSAALGSFTLAQLNAAVSDADLSPTTHTHSGLLPAGGGTGQVIKKLSATDYDYAWGADTGGGGGLSDGDYGDIIVSGSGTVLTIDSAALAALAPLASPALTGTPTAPTAAAYTNTTQLATTAQVYSSVTSVPENAQTGTAYTLVLADTGKMVTMSNAAAITLTVPANATVAFPVNTRIDLIQWGAGQVTVAAAVGVTIRSKGSKLKLSGQYAGATLWKKATDEWLLVGDMTS